MTAIFVRPQVAEQGKQALPTSMWRLRYIGNPHGKSVSLLTIPKVLPMWSASTQNGKGNQGMSYLLETGQVVYLTALLVVWLFGSCATKKPRGMVTLV